MASIQELAAALKRVATPGMKPKALRAAIRELHPDASKKEIVRAAFYAVAEVSPSDHHGVAELHEFALVERGSDDEPATVATVGKPRKKHRASWDREERKSN
jgi:hypothetical protein